jgi:hypothetical protein
MVLGSRFNPQCHSVWEQVTLGTNNRRVSPIHPFRVPLKGVRGLEAYLTEGVH